MITADPGRRQERLNEVMGLLGREAAPGDLLLSFAPHVFAELPDTLALGLPAPALAARLRDHYDFFARSIPPSTQLYRGLPGLHVVVRNLDHFSRFLLDKLLAQAEVDDVNSSFVLRTVKRAQGLALGD